jgi:hypothetical protein
MPLDSGDAPLAGNVGGGPLASAIGDVRASRSGGIRSLLILDSEEVAAQREPVNGRSAAECLETRALF